MNADARASRSPEVDAFLRGLRDKTQHVCATTALPEPVPGTLREVVAEPDLGARLEATARAAGCSVRRVSAAHCAAAVCEILAGLGARRVLVELAAVNERAPLSAALADRSITVVTERDDETLFAVDAAVTDVRAAVAETGTIVCASGEATARGSSLIPPVHVAVVAESQIVPDLLDFFDDLADSGLPANVNLITGPSKTADIEGVLVTGVHGPGQLHIVLVTDR